MGKRIIIIRIFLLLVLLFAVVYIPSEDGEEMTAELEYEIKYTNLMTINKCYRAT